MRVSIVGAGYVGLVTAACLSKLGNEVTLIEINKDRVKMLKSKKYPFYEEGLDQLLDQYNVEVENDYCSIMTAEVVFICVGTPSNGDGCMSMEQIKEAAKQISIVLSKKDDYCLICVKSTVVPGTTEKTIIPILEESGKKAGVDFGICMSPEFLREGMAITDFMNPARIIIGEYDRKSGDMFKNLFKDIKAPILHTDLRTAEMTKLACNVFLATKISFINEIGNICKHLNIDVKEVVKGMAFDDRIGGKFLNAGLGFGGSCLPKDISALTSLSKEMGYDPRLLQEVININELQALRPVEILSRYISLCGAKVGILGLAFKPGTNDIRESRAIGIVRSLLKEKAFVYAYDPLAVEDFRKLFPDINYVSPREVLESDAILIVTEWEEFNELDYKGKIVIDGRGIPKAKEAKIYEGLCW